MAHPSSKFEITLALTVLVILANSVFAVPILPQVLNVLNAVDPSQIKLNYKETKDTSLGEARIILPKLDNNGTSLEKVREELEVQIVDLFGGFSNFEGLGGWKSEDTGFLHHESVWFYDIALPDTQANHGRLLEVAVWLRDKASQESVYLRFPNGEVNFV